MFNPYQNYSQNNSSIIWVQGEAGAKAYPVAPSNSLALFDSENECFYIKTSDASGMPLPLRVFDYKERKKEVIPINTIQENQVDYVTRKEFEEFVEKMTQKNQYVRRENKPNGKQTVPRDSE